MTTVLLSAIRNRQYYSLQIPVARYTVGDPGPNTMAYTCYAWRESRFLPDASYLVCIAYEFSVLKLR